MAADIHTVLVEDKPDIAYLLHAILDAADGFVVVGLAENGADAVDLALAEQPDLVLLDVRMPVMDGNTALPLIRQAAPQAKVVYLTVLTDPQGPKADATLPKGPFIAHPADGLRQLRALTRRPR